MNTLPRLATLAVASVVAALGVVACVGDDPGVAAPAADRPDAATASATDSSAAPPLVDAGTDVDAGDASTGPACDLAKGFNPPEVVLGLSPQGDGFWMDPTETEIVTSVTGAGGSVGIARATRTSTSAPFSSFVPYDELNATGFYNRGSTLSADRLTIFFFSDRAGPPFSIWKATRSSPTGTFSTPVMVGLPSNLTGPINVIFPWWIDPQHVLLDADPGYGTYRATLTGTTFSVASELAELTPFKPGRSKTTLNEALIVFAGDVSGVSRIYEARRAGGVEYQTPRLVTELDTPAGGVPSWISTDGCRLYFTRLDASDVFVAIRKK